MKPMNKPMRRRIMIAALLSAAAMLFLAGMAQSDHVLASSQGQGLAASGQNNSMRLPGNALNANHKFMPADTWSTLSSGLDLDCDSIVVSGTAVYAGGAFSHAGGVLVNHVAKWDGSAWSALGSGLNNSAYAVAVGGSDVYAGGTFLTAGGSPASHIARWNGSSWSALGSGTNNVVSAIAISGSNVYVGGDFTTAGGAPANFVAKWDGTTWSALGSGVNGYVYGLAVSGNDLYVTGQFTTAGGVSARDIAKWNGSSWSALGSGLGDIGRAVAISGSDVYAVGHFTTAGGVSANRVARWDGSSWHALGSGLDSSAYAVLANGPDVYVAGRFTAAGGAPASRVAGWNGSSWFDLAGGVTYTGQTAYAYTLAMDSNGLYVGGSFTHAGGIPAAEIALWQTTGLPTITPGPSLTPTNTPTNTPTRTRTRTPTNTPTRTSSPTATFTSVPGDNPPTVTVPLNRPYRIGVEVGNYLALRFDGSDPDVGDSVTFSISGLPTGASFPIPSAGNPIYSTLTWHPTAPDIGTYYVTVIGTDSHGAQDAATVEIDVVPGCVPYFSDVFTDQYFYPGVQYLFCHLVVSGYIEPDQTFTYRPFNNTTRGQFSKMIAGAYSLPPYNPPTPDFTDVPVSNPFYSYIEAVYHAGIVSGYSDHTFRPFASITRGQLSKLIVGAAGWAIDTSGGPHFTDVPAGSTFYDVIETAYHHSVITGYPCGGAGEQCDPQNHAYFRVGNTAIRGQIAKILWIALGSPSPR